MNFICFVTGPIVSLRRIAHTPALDDFPCLASEAFFAL